MSALVPMSLSVAVKIGERTVEIGTDSTREYSTLTEENSGGLSLVSNTWISTLKERERESYIC